MRSHLQGCALKMQTVKSHQAMADAMMNTAKAMKKMNKAVNVQTITSELPRLRAGLGLFVSTRHIMLTVHAFYVFVLLSFCQK